MQECLDLPASVLRAWAVRQGLWNEAQATQQILQAPSGLNHIFLGAPTGRRLTTVTCRTACDGSLVPRGRLAWWHAAMPGPPRSTLWVAYPRTAATPPTLTTLQLHPAPVTKQTAEGGFREPLGMPGDRPHSQSPHGGRQWLPGNGAGAQVRGQSR